MAKKKSFSFGSDLTQALSDTVSAAQNYVGDLRIEVIPLRKMELDPDNPRELCLGFDDIQNGISKTDKQYKKKSAEKSSLSSMATSITNQGILNPIIVYKEGDKYRVVAGERRTLASIIANKQDIPSKVLQSKPDALKLSLLQWIENMEREDLSLWERISNITKIIEAHKLSNDKPTKTITAKELSGLIGGSPSQASQYITILSGPEALLTLIQQQQISNVEKAALIAHAPESKQPILMEQCLQGATLSELKQLSKEKQENIPKQKKGAGRKPTRVNFGSTESPQVAKIILSTVLNEARYSHLQANIGTIDWEDLKSITRSFQKLLQVLETELASET